MSTKSISQLDELLVPTDDDLLVTVSDGSNYKITKSRFLGSGNNYVQYFNPDSYGSSVVFGVNNQAYGYFTTNVGHENYAAPDSVVFGGENNCAGYSSVVLGKNNYASNTLSTSVGRYNTSSDYGTISFGLGNTASGRYSTAIGSSNLASNQRSTAVGYDNNATGYSSTAIGCRNNTWGGYASFVAGYLNDVQYNSECVAIGYQNNAFAYSTIAIGNQNFVSASYSIVAGYRSVSYGDNSVVIGRRNTTDSNSSIAVGRNNTCASYSSISFGNRSNVTGEIAISVGKSNVSSSYASLVVGNESSALNDFASVFGSYCTASGYASNVFGFEASASGGKSTSIGYRSVASVENTINFGGRPIVQKSQSPESIDYDPYCGVETILMSPVVDLTQNVKIDSNDHPVGFAFKLMKNDSTFFANEIGVIITEASGTISSNPVIALGNENGAISDIDRIQAVKASGAGSSIVFNWSQPTVEGNTLVAVCAAADLSVAEGDPWIVFGTLSTPSENPIFPNRYNLRTYNGITIATFIYHNAVACDGPVTFSFNSSASSAIGFIMEYSGITGNNPVSHSESKYDVSSSAPATPSYSTNSLINELHPGTLTIGVIANLQDSDLTSPTNGFSVIDQGSFGSFQCAVLQKINDGTTSTETSVTSSSSADYVSSIDVCRSQIAESVNMLMPTELQNVSTNKRYKFTDISSDGYTFLWAGNTNPAVVTGGGIFGRFYWKGFLVENQ